MGVSKSKVLLVEDSKFLRVMTERVLSRAGFLVSTAADGEEALRIAKEQLPDIVLLDMMIPKISGPDVLKALKENPATTHIPVIVLSSLSQQNEERLIGQGAAAYFEKSTLELDKGSDRLATTIQSVLNRARKQSKQFRLCHGWGCFQPCGWSDYRLPEFTPLQGGLSGQGCEELPDSLKIRFSNSAEFHARSESR